MKMASICCYMDRECSPECTAYMNLGRTGGLKIVELPNLKCVRLLVDFTVAMSNTFDYPPSDELEEDYAIKSKTRK